MGLGKYIKTAFVQPWNLLALFGSLGFAFLSGSPEVFTPIILGLELGYLGMLGTHPKFQKYVDATEAAESRAADTEQAMQTLQRILGSLPRESIERYEALRGRCAELRQIAYDLKSPTHGNPGSLENLQLAGLDRLLWVLLRLLFTEYSLERFLKQTNENRMQRDIETLEQRIDRTQKSNDSPQKQRILTTLDDNLKTCRERLANYKKAQDNLELVQLELDRLENKIRALSELAINRQDTDFISGQVDEVASSMMDTERTMNELEFATGLHRADEEVPQLVDRQAIQTRF